MRSSALRMVAGVCLFAAVSFCDPRSGGSVFYERIICVVPMVGSGTLDDPKRPMFAPVAGQALGAQLSASKGFLTSPTILSYHSVPTDDGLRVIVVFSARDRAAFNAIRASTDPSVQVFDPHDAAMSSFVQALRLLKKDFDLSTFGKGGL